MFSKPVRVAATTSAAAIAALAVHDCVFPGRVWYIEPSIETMDTLRKHAMQKRLTNRMLVGYDFIAWIIPEVDMDDLVPRAIHDDILMQSRRAYIRHGQLGRWAKAVLCDGWLAVGGQIVDSDNS